MNTAIDKNPKDEEFYTRRSDLYIEMTKYQVKKAN